jgi:hypothetical protein
VVVATAGLPPPRGSRAPGCLNSAAGTRSGFTRAGCLARACCLHPTAGAPAA